jgi:hypothetical protein
MLKTSVTCIAIAPLAFALALATSDMASAKHKAKKVVANPTYEEAWGLCTKQISHIPRQNAGQRQAAGGACMHKYGYTL